MKRDYAFHFVDEPTRKSITPRARVAELLRSYRRADSRYTVKKIGHRFIVRLNYPGSPLAVFAPV